MGFANRVSYRGFDIVGNGIIRNVDFIKKVIDVIQDEKLEMLEFNVSESKISIDFKNVVSDEMLEKVHSIILK